MPDQQRQNVGCAFAVADHEDVAGRHSAERGYYLPVDVTAFALVEGAQQVGDVGLAAACGVRIGTQHPHAETLLDTRQLLFEIAYGQETVEQTWTGHEGGFFDPSQRRFGLLVAPRGLSLARQKILGNPLPRRPPIPEPPRGLVEGNRILHGLVQKQEAPTARAPRFHFGGSESPPIGGYLLAYRCQLPGTRGPRTIGPSVHPTPLLHTRRPPAASLLVDGHGGCDQQHTAPLEF